MEHGASEAPAFPPPLFLAPNIQHGHEDHGQVEMLVSRHTQLAAVAGNLAVGGIETAVSAISSAFSGVSDGLHNAIDSVTYWKQFENLRGHLTEEQRQQNRKISYWLLSATATAIGVKAGYDFVSGHEGDQHPLHMYAAAGSLALNGVILGAVLRGVRKRNANADSWDKQDVKGLLKHFLISDMPSSAIAVLGAVLYKHGLHNVEQAMTAFASGFGAWTFRPTTKNLNGASDHNHFMVCNHDHHGQTDTYHRDVRRQDRRRYARGKMTASYLPAGKSWLRRLTYSPRHAKRY